MEIKLEIKTAITVTATAGVMFLAGALAFNPAAYPADVYGGMKDERGVDVAPERGVSWTGLYIGGAVGYGISQHSLSAVSTESFAATPSTCWAKGAWSATSNNAPKTGQFDLDIFDSGTPTGGTTHLGTDIGTSSSDTPDKDPRIHTVSADAGASITDVTSEECKDIRQSLHLIDGAGKDTTPGITSGYDPAVAAHDVVTKESMKHSDAGFEGGLSLGADYQLQRIVVGVRGDYNWSAIDGKDNDWLIAGRAGALLSPRTLAYALIGYGGASYGDVDFSGWAVGGGLEHALTNNIFVGLEYQHRFYDTETLVNTPNLMVKDDLDEDKIMATLKIKLNGGLFGN